MTRLNRRICTALAALTLCGAAHARTLDAADPERAGILEAAHRASKVDGRFVVLDIVRDGDAAYFCAVIREASGEIERTDESVDLYQFGLRRHGSTWEAFEFGPGLGNYPPKVEDCRVDGRVLSTRADIVTAIRRWGRR